MKKILLISVLLLSACANKFDTAAYVKMVDATETINPDTCSLPIKDLQANISKFKTQLDWLYYYENGFPNNHLVADMIKNIMDEANRFNNIVQTSTISSEYCVNKSNGMRHALEMVINTEGRKY
jgi:hypothetical protein